MPRLPKAKSQTQTKDLDSEKESCTTAPEPQAPRCLTCARLTLLSHPVRAQCSSTAPKCCDLSQIKLKTGKLRERCVDRQALPSSAPLCMFHSKKGDTQTTLRFLGRPLRTCPSLFILWPGVGGAWPRHCKRQRTVPERMPHFTVGNPTRVGGQGSDEGSPSQGKPAGGGRIEDKGKSVRSSGNSLEKWAWCQKTPSWEKSPSPGGGVPRPNENAHRSRTQRQTCPAS